MQESDTVKIATLICGVITAIAVPIVGAVVSYFMWHITKGQTTASDQATNAALQATNAAAEAVKVKVALEIHATSQAVLSTATNAKLDVIAHQTNSLTDILVAKTDEAAYSRGKLDQQTDASAASAAEVAHIPVPLIVKVVE